MKLIAGESVEAERSDVAEEVLESTDLLMGEVAEEERDWRPAGDVIDTIL